MLLKKLFYVSNNNLEQLFSLYHREPLKNLMEIPKQRLPIAYIELIAVLAGFCVFSQSQKNTVVKLYTDNTDVVAWLQKSRCRAGLGFKILSAIEYFKRSYRLKICTRHIPGKHNNTADLLSRGKIPSWLQRYGIKREVNLKHLFRLIRNPLRFWIASK